MKVIAYAILVISALPLALYIPFFSESAEMLSNIRYYDGPSVPLRLGVVFALAGMVYPVVLAASVFAVRTKMKKQEKRAGVVLSFVPACYILVLAVLFAVWAKSDGVDLASNEPKQVARTGATTRQGFRKISVFGIVAGVAHR